MVDRSLPPLSHRAETWLRETALPLWAGRGFDASAGLFEEQSSFDGAPVLTVPRRVMVQCRQIAVFASAGLSGRFPGGGALATSTMRRVIERYHEADGRPGWVFSIDREGRVAEGKRDLYAHAFVLFALACVMRVERYAAFEAAVEATLRFLDDEFADPRHGGFWDCLPRPDALRRQNPHMHLFEACLALHAATGSAEALARAAALHRLAIEHFLDPVSGALREDYDDAWRVQPAPGAGRVEPGHLFEWAWLLRRYEAASGLDQTEPVAALLRLALGAGFEPASGRVVDAIGEDGRVRARSSRTWPHTEALKAVCEEKSRGGGALPAGVSAESVIAALLGRLERVHLPETLPGGWMDHVDADDRPLVATLPASTLYHLHFGLAAVFGGI